MSADMSYQALPPAAGLIELARQDCELGEVLAFAPQFFVDKFKRSPRPWPAADRLCQKLREMSEQFPGVEKRNCFLDSRWDALYYLLSANRRREISGQADITFEHAVLGAEDIAEHVQGAQGAPVKYVRPDEVISIARLLETMSPLTLRKHYDPARMSDAGVYKFWSDRGEEEWADVEVRFAALRQFYLDAAHHGEGVMVVLD